VFFRYLKEQKLKPYEEAAILIQCARDGKNQQAIMTSKFFKCVFFTSKPEDLMFQSLLLFHGGAFNDE